MKIAKGLLETSQKYERSGRIHREELGQKEQASADRVSRSADWKLVQPAKPTEKTRDMYRFAVAAAPGAPAKLIGRRRASHPAGDRLEQLERHERSNTTSDSTTISEPVKTALVELLQRSAIWKPCGNRSSRCKLGSMPSRRNRAASARTCSSWTAIRTCTCDMSKSSTSRKARSSSDRTQLEELQQQIDKAQSSLDDYPPKLTVVVR